MATFETIAAYTGFGLGIFNAAIGVVVAARGSKARERQRALREDLRKILIGARSDAETAVRNLKAGGNIEEGPPTSVSQAYDEMKKLRGELKSPSWQYLDETAVSIIHIESMWNVLSHTTTFHLNPDGTPSESGRRLRAAQENQFIEMVASGVKSMNKLLATIRRIDHGNVLIYLAHRI